MASTSKTVAVRWNAGSGRLFGQLPHAADPRRRLPAHCREPNGIRVRRRARVRFSRRLACLPGAGSARRAADRGSHRDGRSTCRDTDLNRDMARPRAAKAPRSHPRPSGSHAPCAEKTQPPPVAQPPWPRRHGQHARYQPPFDVLQLQACFARAMVDFGPRCAP